MKPRCLGFAAAMFVLMVAASASANSIVNGSFETGDYSGWTLLESPDSAIPDDTDWYGTWGIAQDGQTIDFLDEVYDFYDNVMVTQNSDGLPHTYHATDGNFVALQLQNYVQEHRMYQDVALAPGTQTLNWDMEYTNHALDELGFPVFLQDFQYLALTVRDLSDVVLGVLFETTPDSPGQTAGMTSFSASLAPWAGQTVRLSVDLQTFGYYFDAAFDNFETTVNEVPEPASLLLLGTGLAIAGRQLRRRRSAPVSIS